MNIAVFCSANDMKQAYTRPARLLASYLADRGHAMIYGGSDHGLMKVMADGMQRRGARIVGVTIPTYHPHARQSADELMLAQDLHERKAIILDRADVIVLMVGGLGTLDEITEMLELKKQKVHDKPILVLNTNGFYDGLRCQLQRMHQEQLLKIGEHTGAQSRPLDELVRFASTANELAAMIDATE